MKGIAITVGKEKNASVCYDTDLLRLSMAWTGPFLDFGNTLVKIEWPPPPQVKGNPVFSTATEPGWAKAGSFADPREKHQGPLPKDWAHYEGLYINGDQVILKYKVGNSEVLETPGFEQVGEQALFTRTIQFSKSLKDQVLEVADRVESGTVSTKLPDEKGAATSTRLVLTQSGIFSTELSDDKGPITVALSNGKSLAVAGTGLPKGSILQSTAEGRLILKLGALSANKPFRLVLSSDSNPAGFAQVRSAKVADLRALTKGGPVHWTQTVSTAGVRGTGDGPYVVDTITEPVPNPYNTRTFMGGFDFFSDGRAAICTFHGDVWIVSGLNDSLAKLEWRRFASGMFQPLGLKIVKDVVYVLGRDQITRLVDLNKDGEADLYENFNNDIIVTPNYHEFCLDLHTDTAGNFYFAKGAPWEPEVTSIHQGCLFKVSKDGSKLEIVATGFRAPNGMTVGPHNEITVSDNQGHWMPSSKLNWVEKGGFYGMTPSAQRVLQMTHAGTNITANPSDPEQRRAHNFKAWGDPKVPTPVSYDKPFVWLPMSMDNSSGGQVWANTSKWGALKDQLLFMSYGKCTLFEVMPDVVDGVRQGAMIQFPLKFQSGLMRGRVNPKDGQVYVAGLKGWQNNATREGGFYRVRYTGTPVRMPVGYHVTANGFQLTFSTALNPKSAGDPGNYSIERWNYHWTGAYGSPDFSVSEPAVKKHDRLDAKSVKVSPDGKKITIEVDDMRPADQYMFKYNVDAADGTQLSQEVYGTVYKLGAPAIQ